MGQIASTYDLMPESTEVDLNGVIDDTDEEIGGKLEAALQSIPGIGEVANVDSTVL